MDEKLTDHYLAEIRSEEVQEIVNRVPSWIVRWGTILIFAVFLVFLSISWFVKYPDVLKAEVVITTSPSPVSIVARVDGRLKLLKNDKEPVLAGDVIAFIDGNVNLVDLKSLESILGYDFNTIDPASFQKLNVGEMQNSLSQLGSALQDFQVFHANESYQKQIRQLERQKETMERIGYNQSAQLKLLKSELSLSKEKFIADSLLYSQQVIARLDFNASRATYLQQQRAYKTTERAMLDNKLQIDQLEKQIEDLQIDEKHKGIQLITQANNRLNELKAVIKKWKENHLLVSLLDGKVSYLSFFHDNDYVPFGKPLFSIVPETQHVFGQAELPIVRSGEVKAGQIVNIRLQNYPFEKYGMLTGTVETVSLIPNEEKYLVKVDLPNGLRTSHNGELQVTGQLRGEIEIITEDLRLFERIFYQFRKLVRFE
ncbi:MAG: HlyD family efflux transporter periplasmic adaptor subunit [Cytophagales bacterium]|nr:HlyD family efflux transporter periplasmic adaptor subunit [Cytophagales bacterium]